MTPAFYLTLIRRRVEAWAIIHAEPDFPPSLVALAWRFIAQWGP